MSDTLADLIRQGNGEGGGDLATLIRQGNGEVAAPETFAAQTGPFAGVENRGFFKG
ncbi:unnamed protein product, partial [marine sediment metagenome]